MLFHLQDKLLNAKEKSQRVIQKIAERDHRQIETISYNSQKILKTLKHMSQVILDTGKRADLLGVPDVLSSDIFKVQPLSLLLSFVDRLLKDYITRNERYMGTMDYQQKNKKILFKTFITNRISRCV